MYCASSLGRPEPSPGIPGRASFRHSACRVPDASMTDAGEAWLPGYGSRRLLRVVGLAHPRQDVSPMPAVIPLAIRPLLRSLLHPTAMTETEPDTGQRTPQTQPLRPPCVISCLGLGVRLHALTAPHRQSPSQSPDHPAWTGSRRPRPRTASRPHPP